MIDTNAIQNFPIAYNAMDTNSYIVLHERRNFKANLKEQSNRDDDFERWYVFQIALVSNMKNTNGIFNTN